MMDSALTAANEPPQRQMEAFAENVARSSGFFHKQPGGI
jgi:hypothetical protein